MWKVRHKPKNKHYCFVFVSFLFISVTFSFHFTAHVQKSKTRPVAREHTLGSGSPQCREISLTMSSSDEDRFRSSTSRQLSLHVVDSAWSQHRKSHAHAHRNACNNTFAEKRGNVLPRGVCLSVRLSVKLLWTILLDFSEFFCRETTQILSAKKFLRVLTVVWRET